LRVKSWLNLPQNVVLHVVCRYCEQRISNTCETASRTEPAIIDILALARQVVATTPKEQTHSRRRLFVDISRSECGITVNAKTSASTTSTATSTLALSRGR